MYFDLSQVPFSKRGSYFAVSELTDSIKKDTQKLCLRTVDGFSFIPGKTRDAGKTTIFRFIPLYCGNPIPYSAQASPCELQLKTEFGNVLICFADNSTILMRGEGEKLSLRLSFENRAYIYESGPGHSEIEGVCGQLGLRFRAGLLLGKMSMLQNWDGTGAEYSSIEFSPTGGCFSAAFQELTAGRKKDLTQYDYVSCRDQARQDFEKFLRKMPSVPEPYLKAKELAAYVLWESIVEPTGILGREAILMSKNWMCNIWSWDHCFNAIALSYHDPGLAWEQFMLMFDFQDKAGVIPDCVNNACASYTFVKPPIHGWALSKIMQNMKLSIEQLEEAYLKLSLWTNWWLDYRDHDQDGLCEYFHGNDSGWDNSTAFINSPAVEIPDLAAFLILQMKELSSLARNLKKFSQAEEWEKKANTMLDTMCSLCFKSGVPSARQAYTHQEVPNDSLILYLPVILGKLLPANILSGLLNTLKSKRFYTSHGFATESPQSPFYQSDGYWRGPIWAPSSMLIIDGLYRSGEKGLAVEAASRFVEMVAQNGFAENFDALTGEGLRDRAYTWTASVFLILAHEYLKGRPETGNPSLTEPPLL